MKPPAIRLSRHWPFLVWCVVGLVLFWPVRGYYVALPSPDSPPFFPAAHRLRLLEQMLAGTVAISPHHLISLLVPPLILNDLIYLIDTLLIAAGCAYYLRGRDLQPSAAWIGGGILAFSGYAFTLISAGHMGFFHMTVYATFMFGFLVRGLRGDGWPYFALTGLFGAWVIMFGPDFGPILLLLAAAYGLWLLTRNAAQQAWKVRLRPLAIGLPVASLCFLLGAFVTVRTILTVHLKSRQEQIAGSVAHPSKPDVQDQDTPPTDPQAKWIFATNWSLHPDEIVEFVAPCLFGTQSGDPKAPYWGKLGRTLGWEQHRQGFPSFRQHAIYLGGLQLMLAAFAIGCWWRKRVQVSGFRIQGSGDRGRETGVGSRENFSVVSCELNVERSKDLGEIWLTDVPFWACVWIIGLLLAFGRHAPLYRLFYSLPYMSFLRAPVKFFRLVELATAVLAASGLAGLLQTPSRRLRGWMIGAGVCAGAALLGAIWASGADAAIRQALEPMGLAQAAALLKGNLVRALLHGACAFGVAAGLFFLRGRLRNGVLPLLVLAIVWLAIDALLVNRRFIMAYDMTPYYRRNSIVKQVASGGDVAPAVANYATPSVQQDWFTHALTANGIHSCVPSPQAPATDAFRQLYEALDRNRPAYWELCGANFATLPLAVAQAMAGPQLQPLATFQLVNGEVAPMRDPARGMVLARLPAAWPYAWVTPAWSVVPEAEVLQAVAVRAGRSRTILTGAVPGDYGTETAPAGRVEVTAVRYTAGSLRTVVEIDAPTRQVLAVRIHAQTTPRIVARLDGAPTPIHCANHIWLGLPVPAGRHTLVLHSHRDWPALLVHSLALWLAIGLAAVLACGRQEGGRSKPR